MDNYTGCDAHKQYSVFGQFAGYGKTAQTVRVPHSINEYRYYLWSLPQGTTIALETVGNWYWMVDEMEAAGHKPMLAKAKEAKKMMGHTNKTDKLDAVGLAMLLHNRTLPKVWIPPKEVRDQRELPRTRITCARIRTRLKNRMHSTMDKYNLSVEASDMFGKKGRQQLRDCIEQLPEETRYTVKLELELLDETEQRVRELEKRIKEKVKQTEEMQLLMTMPGVGEILSIIIAYEIGMVERFKAADRLASYAGTTPRIHESGDKTYHGRVRQDVNRYLKWALVEAANSVVVNRKHLPQRHVSILYNRVRERRGHAKAIVAVARHLAEASYWILKTKKPYREPKINTTVLSTQK